MISDEDIFDNIKHRILMMKDINENNVEMESSFTFLKFDSLDYIELQVFIQECYAVKISDQLFIQRTITSIKDTVNYIITQIN
jgi:acyl carrier protein